MHAVHNPPAFYGDSLADWDYFEAQNRARIQWARNEALIAANFRFLIRAPETDEVPLSNSEVIVAAKLLESMN